MDDTLGEHHGRAEAARSLEELRKKLLNRTMKNPLLKFPERNKFAVNLTVPDIDAIYDRLVDDGKSMALRSLPPEDSSDDFVANASTALERLAITYAPENPYQTVPARRGRPPAKSAGRETGNSPDVLQTDIPHKTFDARVRKIIAESNTRLQATGSRSHYLALGFLRYPGKAGGPAASAPLVLLPITIEKRADGFHVEAKGEAAQSNLTLETYLKSEFAISLPPVPDDNDRLRPGVYMEAIHAVLQNLPAPDRREWSIDKSARMAFFSYRRDIVYRDLDPELWPDNSLLDHPHVRRVLVESGGNPQESDIEDESVEKATETARFPTVFEADASQMKVLIRAAEARSFVVQGPPGTGKSQTIANLIAAAMAEGRSILFVAEKQPALDVVYGKLEKVGLGPYCLQLHSDKANPKAILAQAERRRKTGWPRDKEVNESELASVLKRRRSVRERLESYRALMAERAFGLNCTVYDVIWRAESARAKVAAAIDEPEFRCTSIPSFDRETRTPPHGAEWLGKAEDVLKDIMAFRREGAVRHADIWKGFHPPHLTEAQLLDVERILREGHAAMIRFMDLRKRDADIPMIGSIDLAGLFLLESALDDIRPPHIICPPAALANAREMSHPATEPPERQTGGVSTQDFRTALECLAFLRKSHAAEHRAIFRRSDIADDEIAATGDRLARLLEPVRRAGTCLAETRSLLEELRSLQNRLETCGKQSTALAESMGLGHAGSTPREIERTVSFAKSLLGARIQYRGVFVAAHCCHDAHHALELAKSIHERLAAEESAMAEHFSIRDCPVPCVIAGIRTALRESADTWRTWWPFGRVRKAQEQARKFTNGKRDWHSKGYLDLLGHLESLVTSLTAFQDQYEYRSALGPAFNGCKTDWAILDQSVRTGKEIRIWINGEAAACDIAARLLANDFPAGAMADVARTVGESMTCLRASSYLTTLLAPDVFDEMPLTDIAKLIEAERVRLEDDTANLALSTGTLELPYQVWKATIDAVMRFRESQFILERLAARPGFGGVWYRGPYETDPAPLEQTLQWCGTLARNTTLTPELKLWLMGGTELGVEAEVSGSRHAMLVDLLHDMAAVRLSWSQTIDELSRHGDVDADGPFGSTPDSKEPNVVATAWERASTSTAGLRLWSGYCAKLREAKAHGLEPLIDFADRKGWSDEVLPELLKAKFYHDRRDDEELRNPLLASFQRSDHDNTQIRFSEADRLLPSAHARTVADRVYRTHKSLPQGVADGPIKGLSEMGLIVHEIGKRQAHLAPRQLIARAGACLQAMMPCWMMGPGAVATFLTPGKLEFDLLVIDEASQVRVEDAIGSLARARNYIVVGDSEQMPPSDYFEAADSGSGDDDDGEGYAAADMESLLDHLSKLSHTETLLWHYRSQHESLIRFSNDKFYHGKLIIPPAVYRDSPDLGVKWHFCEDACYNASRNPKEAELIADHVVRHIVDQCGRPKEMRESIGVVAMNIKQMECIVDFIDKKRREDPEADKMVAGFDHSESLFVRNLETVQGDERDVIVISMTYGPQPETGVVRQNFMMLNREGGHKRLNVLFTRARRRVHVFSSMKSFNITAAEVAGKSTGLPAFRDYLEFAEHGGIPDRGRRTGHQPDSGFEESVIRVVKQFGFGAEPQVGVEGFRIDIGVVDEALPGMYLCGIECDGAPYHSRRVARDRDRLRQEILEARGWDIYRIWSAAWYRDRAREIERLGAHLRKRQATMRVQRGREVDAAGVESPVIPE